MSHQPPIGQILTMPQERDALHFAIAPVEAAINLSPGAHVQLTSDGRATTGPNPIGIIDPFLKAKVKPGEHVWLFLYPSTVTGMRHHWDHPSFDVVKPAAPDKSESEAWMRAWAVAHMGEDYYGDYEKPRPAEVAYAAAIEAGHQLHIGPYESARDHIDGTWWDHWEKITGTKGERGYFSCSC